MVVSSSGKGGGNSSSGGSGGGGDGDGSMASSVMSGGAPKGDASMRRGEQSANGMGTDGQSDGAVPPKTSSAATHTRGGTHPGISSMTKVVAQLLVTTNDDKIRLIDMENFMVVCKYTGYSNSRTVIGASFSNDGKYVICGSDTGRIHIWNRETHAQQAHTTVSKVTHTNPEHESFFPDASNDVVTKAVFAPSSAVAKATQINPGIYILDYIPDLTSRIIVSADSNGYIKVFSRGLDA